MIGTTRDVLVQFLQEHPLSGKALEVGSLDVNGNVKDILKDFDYIGLDMRSGKNVTLVANAHNIPLPNNSIDLVVCFDTLEHDEMFWLSIQEMRRVLKGGGWLIIGAPSINHPMHDHPNDYYRFFENTFRDVFFYGMKDVWVKQYYFNEEPDELKPDQVMGWGQKIW